MSAEPPIYQPVLWEGKPDDLPIIHDRQVQYRFHLAGGAILDMFAHLRADAHELVISGQDALNRNKPPLPYFARWSWYPHIPCSFITFNDPTLYRSDTMLGGWCQFDAEHFGIEAIAEVIAKLLAAAGLSAADTTLYGTSAGGFWGLMTGALLPEATVVADISQTNLLTYPHEHHIRHLFDVSYPGISHDIVRERFAHRLSVARYYEHIGNRPRRIIYHQNLLDVPHVETQMRPFLAEMAPFGIVEPRYYERTVERGTHCPRDKPGSIAAMLEPFETGTMRQRKHA
jgi:hypothetical protein